MTDQLSSMASIKAMHNSVCRDMDALSMTGRLLRDCASMKDAFTAAATAFNAMRDEMAKVKNCVWSMDVDARQYVSEIASLSGVDCMSFVAKAWDCQLSEVEDTERFEALLSEIAKTTSPLMRLRKCVKAKAALDESLAGWQSKINGMKERAERADANQNEREICERKIFAFAKVVKTITTRRETVAKMFHETKRDILGFVEKQSKKFTKED